jgi:predicted dehydrogenase
MLKLGIVGAENSHSWRLAALANIDKAVRFRVTSIWGERPKFAKAAAERGDIPTIVKDWREMLGEVDGVMIDHRHPKPHYEVAKFFIEHQVPCFVDKPMTWTLREARALLDLGEKKGTPVVTCSQKSLTPEFAKFKKQVAKCGEVVAVNSTGRCNIKSRYGGVFFYGIHQVDTIIELAGTDAKRVHVQKASPNAVATMTFKDGKVATMNALKHAGKFHWRVVTDKGVVCFLEERAGKRYLPMGKMVYALLKRGEVPFTRERMLAPVAVLAAMRKSLETGKEARVGAL